MTEQQSIALKESVEWINLNYRPIAIIASGSIIRGNGNANSDFDIFVVHREPYRQRVQKFFNDVPCEIFINNLQHIQGYFENELKNNRPSAANMLATGKVLLGEDDTDIIELIEKAKTYANRAVELNSAQLNMHKYGLATLLEDASDIIDSDISTAQLLLNRVIEQSMDLVFALHHQPLPRIKERLKLLDSLDAETTAHINASYANNDIQERYKLATAIVLKLTGHTSFYEWESDKE